MRKTRDFRDWVKSRASRQGQSPEHSRQKFWKIYLSVFRNWKFYSRDLWVLSRLGLPPTNKSPDWVARNIKNPNFEKHFKYFSRLGHWPASEPRKIFVWAHTGTYDHEKSLCDLTNLQLNSYPNTQLDLFCNDSFPIFDARLLSTWLTNCANPSTRLQSPTKKVLGCKVLQFIHTMKIKKMLGHKTLRCIYIATSSRERDELGQELRLQSQFAWTEFAVQLVNCLTALKTILLYV